ncbi:MAG: lytic transglycosylase domain-containing protein [Nitrospirota bacterium]
MRQSTLPILFSLILLAAGCSTTAGPGPAAPSAELLLPDEAAAGIMGEAQPLDPAPVMAAGQDGPAPLAAVAEDEAEGDDEGAPLDAALELVESARLSWTSGENDRAIEALDQAYAALLKTEDDGTGKELQQQKDDLRFLISKRLLEIYASKYRTTNGTHKEIPLTVNEHVEREIRLFQTQERDFFIESYRRSGRYRDQMARAFREAGLPEDLTWLPLIESGFKVRALSRARALGLWQFIPSTGYKFGLKRSAAIDERLDPEKATAAAIAYLKELHQIFGDWATALAAYNCGEGAVLRVIRSQKIDYLDNFWDLYDRLPRETSRYYPRFLATLAIIKDPAKYGFQFGELEQPLPYESVTVSKPVSLKTLAAKVAADEDDLTVLNPELRYSATPGGPYILRVPPGKGEAVLATVASLPAWSPPRPAYVVHRVRRGETLSTIAVRYRTSIDRIRDANNLRSTRMIRAGQKLRIPLTNASLSLALP